MTCERGRLAQVHRSMIDVWAPNTHGDLVLGCLELPESDIDGDTTFTLSLQFVKHPC